MDISVKEITKKYVSTSKEEALDDNEEMQPCEEEMQPCEEENKEEEDVVNTQKTESNETIDKIREKKIDDIEELIDSVVKENLRHQDSNDVTESKKPVRNIISEEPLVFTIDNYLTDEECEHFIKISEKHMQRAYVSDNNKGMISAGRTGSNHWVDHHRDDITKRVGERIANEIGHPLEHSEKYQVIHYGPTQEYRRHYDSWEHDYSEKALRCMKWGGARLVTALCYLNTVEEGGGTDFPRLNTSVKAIKGRMVCFENTHRGTHNKHPLAEHAGMPVIKGEKYAFNLWFRECPHTKLYKEHNPEYYKTGEPIIRKRIEAQLKRQNSGWDKGADKSKDYPLIVNYSLKDTISQDAEYINKPIYNLRKIENFIDGTMHEKLMSCMNFTKKNQRDSCWIKKTMVPELTQKLEDLMGIPSDFFENFNAIQYGPNENHRAFHDAYDLTSDAGKRWCETTGQRIYTIVLFLSKNFDYNMTVLQQKYSSTQNDILIYKNTENRSNQRNDAYRHSITNNNDEAGIIVNIYIREKTRSKQSIFGNTKVVTMLENKKREKVKVEEKNPVYKDGKNINLEIMEKEDYIETYEKLFTDLKAKKFSRSWSNKSLTFTHKLSMNIFTEFLQKLDMEKSKYENRSLINPELMEKTYECDEYHPLALNNILRPGVIDIFKDLYRKAIDNKVFPLGDRQAQRYKAHNEAVARVLHYEIHPLIEKITEESVYPTYTYTSFYVKGADLPPHTDRPECTYTVSFIVDKPEGSNWNIYVDLKNQVKKNIGRCEPISGKDECVPVDCDANGLMIFCGEDHCHFREKLEYDYYNILLLHYRRVD